jgi:hypothetical protein
MFHHEYVQFDTLRQVRYATGAFLLAGLFFLFYGLLWSGRAPEKTRGRESGSGPK